MKFIKFAVLIISGIILISSCSDKKTVMTAWEGDKELSEGDLVPFQLYSNYPNPYNPSTRFRFEVYTAMHIKLTVYSEDWYKIKTLFDRHADPGNYSVEFSKDIPSGEYFCMLEGRDYIQVAKVKLVK